MKKIFLIISALATIIAISYIPTFKDVIAKPHKNESFVRIQVGEDTYHNNYSMIRRIRRLEQAVSALQDKVYDLEANGSSKYKKEVTHVCTLIGSYSNPFVGKAKTKAEAIANVLTACKRGGGFPCKQKNISTCEKLVEYKN